MYQKLTSLRSECDCLTHTVDLLNFLIRMCAIQKNKFWTEFIAIYREHEALWCIGSEKYKNQRLRDSGHGALLEKFQEIEPNATLYDVKRRINAMRTCYRRELNKVLRSEASGAEGDYLYVPTLWYFDEFNFLRSQSSFKEGRNFESGYLEEPDDTIEIIQRHTEKINKNTTVRPKAKMFKVKKRYSDYEEIDDESEVKQTMDEVPDYGDILSENSIEVPAKRRKTRDDAEVFSESWAVLFRKCSPEQQIYAKRAIEEILLLGQLDKLSFKSYRFET